MKKKNEKMVPIRVTARFEVTFIHKVPESQFVQLDKDMLLVSDVVDESEAYSALSNDGDCEMEWDYAPPVAPPLRQVKEDKRNEDSGSDRRG